MNEIKKTLCQSHLCTEQLIHTSALSELRESAEISAVWYTNLTNIVLKQHSSEFNTAIIPCRFHGMMEGIMNRALFVCPSVVRLSEVIFIRKKTLKNSKLETQGKQIWFFFVFSHSLTYTHTKNMLQITIRICTIN